MMHHHSKFEAFNVSLLDVALSDAAPFDFELF